MINTKPENQPATMFDGSGYELASSGILVPKAAAEASPSPAPAQDNRISRWINFGSLVIQAITVVVLWLTFKNTVIPTQQKELLAEQVSRLEIEKERTVSDIASAKADMSKLNSTLILQRRELEDVKRERQRLQGLSESARLDAASAKRSEIEAREKEGVARAALVDARWRIFSQEVSFVISRPILEAAIVRSRRVSAEEDSSLTYEQQISRDIDEFDSDWPDYLTLIRETANKISAMRSSHYTIEMADEFSKEFLSEGDKFSCTKPDLGELKKKYLRKLALAKADAIKEAEKSVDDIVRSYKDRGEKVKITDEFRRKTHASYEIGAAIGVKFELDKELIYLPSECQDRFTKIGRGYLDAKNMQVVSPGRSK